MKSRAALAGLLMSAGVLTACAPMPSTPSVNPDPAAAGCDAERAGSLVGLAANPELLEQARQRANARTVRTVRPGEAITKEYQVGRLTVWLDAQGRISRLSCG